MNSRERLLKVLNGEKTDRVPISTYELCGHNSKSFENREPSYKDLMDYIRANTDSITMYDPCVKATFATIREDLHRKFKHTKEGEYIVTTTTLKTPEKVLTEITKRSNDVMTTWKTKHFCSEVSDVDAFYSLKLKARKYNFFDLSRIKKEIDNNGIIMTTIPDPICEAFDIMSFEEGMLWAFDDTEHFKETLDNIHIRQMQSLKNMLSKKVVDLYRICGPEYMTPPYMPPSFFEKFTLPYISDIVQLIHSYGAKVRIHSHGKIGQVLDMILESGADALDPCEAPPDGDITLNEVKKRVGDKMTIFGNIQLKALENGTKEDIRKEVINVMEQAKDNGRFVIMPTASPINIPLKKQTEENYKVFIDTALEYGKY